MPKFLECGSYWDRLFSIDEQSSNFGFGCQGHDWSEFVADSVDGSVGQWVVGWHFSRIG
jgi:hypothetical protein